MEETTTIIEEQETEITQTETQETTTTETTTIVITTTIVTTGTGEPTTIPVMEDNAVHELLYHMGVDLDYTPNSSYECFTMGCRLVSSLVLLIFFLIYLFKLMVSFFKR